MANTQSADFLQIKQIVQCGEKIGRLIMTVDGSK